MTIKLEDPCRCGHSAYLHESEQTEYEFDTPMGKYAITKVKVYTKCNFYKKPDQYAYTNMDTMCPCDGFKMDNLKYLEQRADV